MWSLLCGVSPVIRCVCVCSGENSVTVVDLAKEQTEVETVETVEKRRWQEKEDEPAANMLHNIPAGRIIIQSKNTGAPLQHLRLTR